MYVDSERFHEDAMELLYRLNAQRRHTRENVCFSTALDPTGSVLSTTTCLPSNEPLQLILS